MPQPQQARPKSNIRRRRTGCLTCRERRVRCGEEKPSCRNCSRKSRTCAWGHDVRFLHHRPAIGTRPYKFENEPKATVQHGDLPSTISPGLTSSCRLSNISTSPDETPSLAPCSTTLPPLHSPLSSHASQSTSSAVPTSWHLSASSDTMSPEELSCWQSEVLQSFTDGPPSLDGNVASSICRSHSARLKNSIDLEHASPIPPNLEPNAEAFSDWGTLGASDTVLAALDGNMEMKLLQTYLNECAKWFDCRERHYSRKDVPRMMTCPPWRAAALALSAKYIELRERQEPTAESLSLHLYQLAVTLAIDSISGRFDCVGTTAGCVLLAVYEMMTVTYQDWRRHLRGCTSIYSHNHWNGDSLGLIGASFWNYARIDIWAAFCAGTETMLPSEKWFNHPLSIMRSTNVNEDRHEHIATWLLARVVNMKYGKADSMPRDHAEFLRLRADLSAWESMGASITRPVMQRDADHHADRPFPSILFSSDSSAMGHTMWHTATVLLLEYELAQLASEQTELSHHIHHHARTACGIIETNRHDSCLVNAVQPLWICGRYLKSKAEKFAVLELLAQIEQKTGWKTRWRSDALREMWNLC